MKRYSKDNSICDFHFNSHQLETILKEYSNIHQQLMMLHNGNNKLFQTTNIVGEYAELLVCEALNLIQMPPSTGNFDAIDSNGKKYQIKARWSNGDDSSKSEFGSISEEALTEIDYIILALFDIDFNIKFAYKLDVETYRQFSYVKNNKLIIKPSKKCLSLLDEYGYSIKNILKGE